jgi:hypothetical protein
MASNLSDAEFDSFLETFTKLGVTPKGKTKAELYKWVATMIHIQGASAEDQSVSSGQTSVSFKQPPRITCFSGDPTAKNDTTFDVWCYEVESLVSDKSHSEDEIRQCLRRAVRGEAARIVMRLGSSASLSTIISKLRSVYSSSVTEQGEVLMAQFYSARQGTSEDVTTWGCRLEDMLDRLVSQGHITQERSGSVLKSVFWSGLRQELKDCSGHKFDTIQDFDQLRVAIRRLEYDRKQSRAERKETATPAKMSVPTLPDSESRLMGVINQLSVKIDKMEERLNYGRTTTNSVPPPVARNPRDVEPPHHDFDLENGPRCHRCGQYGHIQIGCIVRVDHLRRGHLNGRGPMPRGRH